MSINNSAQSRVVCSDNEALASSPVDTTFARLEDSPVCPVEPLRKDPKHEAARHDELQHRDQQQPSEESEDDEDNEDEPTFKYQWMTKQISPVYRRDDSTSTTLISGNKKIIGTHRGNVHVLSIPSLQTVRQYHAHSASVTAISVSPATPAFPAFQSAGASSGRSRSSDISSARNSTPAPTSKARNSDMHSTNEVMYLATASYDGHVCVSSLSDPKDVILRNFSRPLQAVSLSPRYGTDRMFLSGGLAGNLILTIGGRTGVTSEANTNKTTAAASGWLNSLGLRLDEGEDTILHSGEGTINTIAWSFSGKYVAWVNGKGIKIMRSSLGLVGNDLNQAWKRIAHIDHPEGTNWKSMASVWKARACWVDDRFVESTQPEHAGKYPAFAPALKREPSQSSLSSVRSTLEGSTRGFNTVERLLVGWGDTVWVIDVRPVGRSKNRSGPPSKSQSNASIVRQISISDGILSGISAYAAQLLLVIVFRTRDDKGQQAASKSETHQGISSRRHRNALQPDLRLIDISTESAAEVEVECLPFPNFEGRSAPDYHLTTIFVPPPLSATPNTTPRVASYGIAALGDAFRDASRQSTRILSSSASLMSGSSATLEKNVAERTLREQAIKEATASTASPSLLTPGLKIFVHSPHNCVLAVKRETADRFSRLLAQENFSEAWNLLDRYPDIIADETTTAVISDVPLASRRTFGEYLEDDASSHTSKHIPILSENASDREKRRIGDLWMDKLISQEKWQSAAEIASKINSTPSQWENWIRKFADAGRFDEIVTYIPSRNIEPRLPSTIYECVLKHYLETDLRRFETIVDTWDPSLFATAGVADGLRAKLESLERQGEQSSSQPDTATRMKLLDSLAKIYLELSLPTAALYCYLSTKNEPAAIDLVRRHNLVSAISDRIFDFITVGIQDDRLESQSIPIEELDRSSAAAVQALASGAVRNLIPVSEIVHQLESSERRSKPLLFFFFRALWNGSILDDQDDRSSITSIARQTPRHRFEQKGATIATKVSTRALLAPYVKLAVSLFAEYSRPLLSELLKYSEDSGTSLTDESGFYEHAFLECERRDFIPELVHLSSATGQNRRALHLIIDRINDVKRAISFAKDIDDVDLWKDLLDYSMDKPVFIEGLLNEGISAGCKLQSEGLVRRIPDGLDIPGLKGGLVTVLKDNDIQASIAEGAAQVTRSEVAIKMDALVQTRNRGVSFEIPHVEEELVSNIKSLAASSNVLQSSGPSVYDFKCAICAVDYHQGDNDQSSFGKLKERPFLVYPCGHVFHLQCVLEDIDSTKKSAELDALHDWPAYSNHNAIAGFTIRRDERTKIARARRVANVIGGLDCKICDV